MKILIRSLITFFLITNGINAQSSQNITAFPGAEGYGRFATGGRGGDVIIVSNLNDRGPGSLREAVKRKQPRIIVFKVSGNIKLESPLEIKHGNLTIAGQTAPGDGICIQNYPIEIKNADNIIIRYIRSRLGDLKKQQEDAISVRFCNNVIIDHCSFSWAVDECASFYTNNDFTLQWCIVSESLNSSVHRKGEHGYGGIWGGIRATFHHNLLAHHKSRNPRFSGNSGDGDIPSKNVDYRNNVIYNWRINSAYGGELGEHNMINNYYKAGPSTKRKVRSRIINPSKPYGNFFVNGNFIEGNKIISANNLSGGIQCNNPEAATISEKFIHAMVTTHPPLEAFNLVLKNAGASYKRDSVDLRVCSEVKNGNAVYRGSITGLKGIIDSQKDVGSWPELHSESYPTDSDNDGMTDEWEVENNLDPSNPADANGRDLDSHYDNIEVYFNNFIKGLPFEK